MIALTLANWLDVDYQAQSRFSLDRVVFGYDQWVKVLDDNHPNGTVIVMEEPEVYFNAKAYLTVQNRQAANKFNTGRFLKHIYLLTYPSFEDIDLGMRKRIHFLIEANDYSPETRMNYWTPWELFRNYKKDPPMLKRGITYFRDGYRYLVDECKTYAVSDDYYSEYASMADPWKKKVQTDRLSKTGGDLETESASDARKVTDARKAQFDKRRETTRQYDLQRIEVDNLDRFTSIRELKKNGLDYYAAHRIWKLLEERRSVKALELVNKQEQDAVLSRQ